MNFLEGFNQAFFPPVDQLLDEMRRRRQLVEAQSNLTNELNPYTNVPAPTAQVPAQAGNATHLSMPAMQMQGVPTTQRQPVEYGSPQMIQALQHYMTSTGQGMDLNSLLTMQGLGQPKYTVSDKGLGGLDIIRQQGGNEPTVKEVRPPLIRPTNPTEASLAMDASNPNSPTYQKSIDALRRIQEIRTAGAIPQVSQDLQGNYYVTQSPKAGGTPTTYDIGVKGNIKGSGNPEAQLDKSYQFHTSQVSALAKPIQDRMDRMDRLKQSLDAHTPQADALVAPELLTAMAGGQGSGLRMNEAEISRIVGGRTAFEGLKSTLQKFVNSPNEPFLITDAQRSQIYSLLDSVHQRAQQNQDAIIDAQQRLSTAETPQEHKKIFSDLRATLGGRTATTTTTNTISPEDQQAINWAKSNRNDPRAQKILQLHGIK